NVTFGLGGAIEAGDADIALKLGRSLVTMAQAKADGSPFMQMIAANGYYAMARFADPAEVLALPKPKLPYLEAAWHYARGEALAWGYRVRRDLAAALLAQGDQAGARRELDAALKYRPKDPGSLAMRRKLETHTAER